MRRGPLWRRYGRLFGRDARAETDAELQFHYEMRVRDYQRRGLDEEAAREAARARMGDLAEVRDECVTMGERYEQRNRRREWLSELRQDVRYGIRVLLRAPVFALAAAGTLALGIGATTAIFSVVSRVLLVPLPYPQPEQLVNVWEHSPQGNDHNVVSAGNYVDWRARTQSFAQLGAHAGVWGMALTGEGEPQQLLVNTLTPSTMEALGVAPLLGRALRAEDGESGDVVVLSHGLWRQRFGAARGVIGTNIVLNGVAYTVVGVMPGSFNFPDEAVQLWLPIRDRTIDPTERRSHNYQVVGRMKAGVTVAQAEAELRALAHTLAEAHPQYMQGWSVNVVSMHGDLTADAKPMLLVLLATVLVVLLIACGNLANLLLARAVARENEFSLRGALGAGRARIIRQLITESLLIGVLGGVAGLLLASLLLRLLLTAAPASIPLIAQTRINWSVLSFAAALTLLSTLLFGLVPALRAARTDLHSALRARRGGGVGHARLRGTLLVAQVTLCVVLLMGAGLLVRSFVQVQRTNMGYATQDLVLLYVNLPSARYRENEQHINFQEQLLARLSAVPGVRMVAGTSRPPGDPGGMTFSFGIEGRPAASASGREDPEELHAITPTFFSTMGIPILGGRVFSADDRAGAPEVVIINEALARKHWPAGDAVGKRIAFRPNETAWMEIVGVVGNTRMVSPDLAPVPALYIPHSQKTWPWLSWSGVLARVTPGSSVEALRPRFQAALWELDDQLPLLTFSSVEQRYAAQIAARRFAMQLVLTFALVALLLSVVGLYGLMAYTVAQQRQEFGVRMALGASNTDIVRAVLRRSLRLAGLGLLLGLACSLATVKLLSSLLYGVSPRDPVTMTAIAILVLMTAGLAAWLPARRAVRSDPLAVLKGA